MEDQTDTFNYIKINSFNTLIRVKRHATKLGENIHKCITDKSIHNTQINFTNRPVKK